MNLFLLSKTDNLNSKLRLALSEEINKHNFKVAYISSVKQTEEKKYYLSTIEDFKKINESSVVDYFDLSTDFSNSDLDKLKDYNIIYFSGGNTFAFLKEARERGLDKILKGAQKRFLLIGASAGSILMTPRINICEFCDSNAVELLDLSSFNFTPFEFHPHFKEEDLAWLKNYKKDNKTCKILACKDGDGVQYKNGEIILFGEVVAL